MPFLFSPRELLEQLESRQLLSATLSKGVLTIIGTAKADVLVITQNSANVRVSENGGVPQQFTASDVRQISIDLAGGDDRVQMQAKGGKLPVKIPALIQGSKGNDTLRGGFKNDTLLGGSGDDNLEGGAGADSMVGGDGIDVVDYSARINSVIVSFNNLSDDGETREDDNVQVDQVVGGLADDDFIIDPKDAGHDISGGPGTDIVDYGEVTHRPPVANNISLDDIANDGVKALDNIHKDIENVYGSRFNDHIIGSSGRNVLLGNDGDDTIEGGDGNDTLSGGAGQDSMLGQGGDDFFVNINASDPNNIDNDTLNGGSDNTEQNFDQDDPLDFVSGVNNDFDARSRNNKRSTQAVSAVESVHLLAVAQPLNITGTSGADKIVINQNATVISYVLNGVATTVPASGVSRINVDCAGGNDSVVMSKGDGTNMVSVPTNVSGGNGNDSLKGGSNRDTIGGGNGNDLLVGNDENDSLVGGLGSDNLQAGNGDDYMVGDTSSADTTGFGADNFQGGAGNDTADYNTRADNLTVTMDDDLANDGGTGGVEGDNVHSDVENIFAGVGNDTIVGNASANFLSGFDGNDSLVGQGGSDKIVGGNGKDTLQGNTDIDLFFMSDSTKDVFDVTLNRAGSPTGDFVNGDINVDLSSASNRGLGVAG